MMAKEKNEEMKAITVMAAYYEKREAKEWLSVVNIEQ